LGVRGSGVFFPFSPGFFRGVGVILARPPAARGKGAFFFSRAPWGVLRGGCLFFGPGFPFPGRNWRGCLSTRYHSLTPPAPLGAAAAILTVCWPFPLAGRGAAAHRPAAADQLSHAERDPLGLLLGVVAAMTGPMGLLICAVAPGIGLIPVLWGSRRMNAMGLAPPADRAQHGRRGGAGRPLAGVDVAATPAAARGCGRRPSQSLRR